MRKTKITKFYTEKNIGRRYIIVTRRNKDGESGALGFAIIEGEWGGATLPGDGEREMGLRVAALGLSCGSDANI